MTIDIPSGFEVVSIEIARNGHSLRYAGRGVVFHHHGDKCRILPDSPMTLAEAFAVIVSEMARIEAVTIGPVNVDANGAEVVP